MDIIEALNKFKLDNDWIYKVNPDNIYKLPFIDITTLPADRSKEALSFFNKFIEVFERKDYKSKYPFSYYHSFFVCKQLSLYLGKTNLGEVWDYHLLRWFRICYRSINDADIKFYFQYNGIDPEEEMRTVVFDKDNSLRKEIKNNIKNNIDAKVRWYFYIMKVVDWFLARYDLKNAAKLICHLSINKSMPPNRAKIEIPYIFIIITLIVLSIFFFSQFSIENLFIFQKRSIEELFRYFTVNWFVLIIECLTIIMFIIFLIFLLIDLLCKRDFSLYFKLLIPRLLAGTLIGYLPILIGSELWLFIQNINAFEGFIIVITTTGFCFYYLFSEVKNVVIDTRLALMRGLRIFLIGLLESFTLGLIILDLFARAFVHSFENDFELEFVYGLFGGQIYPKILIILFPLALFIGIFVQIIWEDKPITHPL